MGPKEVPRVYPMGYVWASDNMEVSLNDPTVRRMIGLGVTAVAVPLLMNEARKPTRWLGRLMVSGMNASHSGLTDWGLGHVTIGKAFTVLDVGCGGGLTIRKMAAIASQGRVFGVDYARGSVDGSRALNAQAIREGRVEVREASVSSLPFADATFDLVTAVETHYYWPDLPGDLREILRVVKPGGTALVIAESYKGGKDYMAMKIAMLPLRAKHLSADEHRAWFETAGFSEVQVFEERSRGWICVTGRKPASS